MSANPTRKILRRHAHAQHRLGKPRGTWGWRVAHGARTAPLSASRRRRIAAAARRARTLRAAS